VRRAHELLVGQLCEPALYEVQPGRAGRCEAQVNPWMREESPLHDLGLVSRVVIENQVDVQLGRHSGVDLPGEASQQDLDQALPVLDVGVADVGEDAPLGCLLTNSGSRAMDQDDDRQAVSRTIFSIRPSAWSELSPRPTSATCGRSRAVTAPTSLTSISRAITSCPSAATIGARRARRSLRSFGDQDAQMLGLAVAHEWLQPSHSNFGTATFEAGADALACGCMVDLFASLQASAGR
jgi:hypothetical protein